MGYTEIRGVYVEQDSGGQAEKQIRDKVAQLSSIFQTDVECLAGLGH